MKIEMRSRDKRALVVLGVSLVVYLALSTLVVPAFNQLRAAAGMAQNKEEELRKYRRAFANREHYAQLLDQARRTIGESEGRFIRGDNPSLAQVELQGLVEAAEQKVNIPPAQYTVSPAKKKDQYFTEMTYSLSIECTPNQLVSFLAALRDSPKFVTVRNLQITPVQTVFEAPSKGEVKKTVRASLMISALLANAPTNNTTPAASAAPKG